MIMFCHLAGNMIFYMEAMSKQGDLTKVSYLHFANIVEIFFKGLQNICESSITKCRNILQNIKYKFC